MDALSDKTYIIWFGGTYREHWSENYILSVEYEDRRLVEARFSGTRWEAVGGDAELMALLSSPDCPGLTYEYFQAAAGVYAAVHDCLDRGIPLERLGERLHPENSPLAAPELMRLLMDDCGFSMDAAYQITAGCCDELTSPGIFPQELRELQPRTANIVGLLRHTAETVPALIHDSRLSRFRSVYGAAQTGDELRLSFLRRGGRISEAELVLWGDDCEHSYSMERNGNEYYVNLTLPAEPQVLYYAFYVETPSSAHWLCPGKSGFTGQIFPRRTEGFRLTVFRRGFETPEWFRRSVMYQIFPDRFGFSDDDTAEKGIEYHISLGQTPQLHKSLDEPVRYLPRSFEEEYRPDDFYGGTFRGIERKLPYLKELGAGCVYLNPIVEARSNHRYDTSDYSRPDPILGTTEDFEHLCRTAEKLGIRIILDGVYSHTGCDSVYFDRSGCYGGKGACQGKESPYYHWYDFRQFPDDYRCWWGFKDLPEVDELSEDWQDFIITGKDSIVKTWLRRGASGWRLDVADELPDSVLSLIRTAAKSVKPDAPIIGEVWEDATVKESYGKRRKYALGDALDSVMNYPLRTALLDFINGRSDAFALRDFLISQQMNYPKPMYYSLMNLLSSHDIPRILTSLETPADLRKLSRAEQLEMSFSAADRERALKLEKLCAAVQFSIPGVPSIYYGDEQGMEGMGDPFNRMPFRELDAGLRDYYARLASMRNSNAALSAGEAFFYADSADVLLIVRLIRNGKDAFGAIAEDSVCVCAVNRADREKAYRVDCTDAGLGIMTGRAGPLSAELEMK